MKRIDPSRVKKMKSHLADTKGLEKLPALLAFLTDTTLEGEGGTTDREPGSIYLQPRDGQLAVTLKEPSQSLMLRIEVPNLTVLLPLIEAALADGGSLWEADLWARKGRRKK